MRKVLIVSPHFPPVNAPDMQRVRLALPHLRALGWEPVVLAVHPDSVEGAVIESLLEKTYPTDIRVIRVAGIAPRTTRALGFGSLWWRCSAALRRAGDRLLATESFDLVLFSTTQFGAFTLGPRWLRRFRVPYVLDYQDPWVNDYYRRTGTRPPGGAVKFRLGQFLSRRREPGVLRKASGVIAVSGSYGPDLHERYPWFAAASVKTLPFGTAPADFEVARQHPPAVSLVPFGDGCVHHVYAGRCGPDMRVALTALFLAVKKFRSTHPSESARHRFHFIGTDYAPPPLGRAWVSPLASEAGVSDLVNEHSGRVPYFEALHYLTRADALIVVGSDDPTYSASKIAPYLQSHRPLLAIAHTQSPMITLASAQPHAVACGFSSDTPSGALAEHIWHDWFAAGGWRHAPDGKSSTPAAQNAADMAAALTRVFDEAVARHSSQP
ncbi:MAG: glycosyltransferase [Opitutaceae bacterium]|nr:glycosyltransferase [Opitutaceae bacterium]